MSFISVIIPIYNKEKFLKNTIESVLNQTFNDFELILVNDGSTDNSLLVLDNFKDSRIRYYFKENGGVSSARNLGIEKAKSKYITFIDADDYWYPNFLEKMVENTTRFPNQKIFSAAIEIEIPQKIFPTSYSIKKKEEIEIVNYFKASLKDSIICTSCTVFHHTIFDEIGLFDTTLKCSEDIDLWIRMGLKYPIVFSWEILARYTYDASSLTKTTNYLEHQIHFHKFKTKEKTNPDLKKFLDLIRFSLAIKSKVADDLTFFKKISNDIELKELNFKKRILLILPAFVLKKLINFNFFLAKIGLVNSFFK